MILDTITYNSTGPYSTVKVLCRCESCGSDRLVFKNNITRRGHALCHKCAVTASNRRTWCGRKHTHEALAKMAEASRGRRPSEATLALLSAARRGEKNVRWNPDRDAVLRNEKARRSIYRLMWQTLYRVGRSKEHHTQEALGYSAAELAAHIEAQFEPGMSWEDRSAWHIDHIKPVRAFVREGITDPRIINALSNLRPLWAKENMSLAGRHFGRGMRAALEGHVS